MKLNSVVFTAVLLSSVYSVSHASTSCRSIQGYWVDYASSETEKLKSSIKALESMQKKSCKTFIDNMNSLTQKLSGFNLNTGDKKVLDLPSKIKESLEMASMSQDDKVTHNLVKNTLSSQAGVNQNLTNDPRYSLFQRARTYIADNSKLISDLSADLSSQETTACLDNANAAGQAIKAFGSVATILSAFTGAGVGEITAVVDAAGSLVKALSNRNIEKAMNSIEATQMLSTLSCVVETTVANYCEVQDAYDFYQEISKNSSRISQLNKKYERISSTQSNALDSYFILHRDLPNIVSWIIKTKMVNVPYSDSEARTQNEYANVINNFYNRIRTVYGIFQTKKREIYSEGCDDLCKKRIIASMIGTISENLLGRQEEQAGLRVNFFVQQYDPTSLPFAIIGKAVPPAVTGQFEDGASSWTDPLTGINYGSLPVEPTAFLRNGGRNNTPHPYLNDPITMINIIGDNLEKIFDNTIKRATSFELENLVGDKTNLVTRLTSSPTTSVHGSFRNIRNYLKSFKFNVENKLKVVGGVKLVDKLNSLNTTRLDLGNASSQSFFNGQKNKLTKEQFDMAIALRDINELLSKVDPILEVMNKYAEGTADANEVLFVLYNKLLISVNGANFLPNRIETLAQVELRMSLRDDSTFIKDNFKDWFLVSDQTLHSFISPTTLDTQTSAAIRESQLNTAVRIADTNLSALELTYSDWLFAYIVSLRAIEFSTNSNDATSNNYAPETQAMKVYSSALLDYNIAVENKVPAKEIERLKKIKDEKFKKWIYLTTLKINPQTSVFSIAYEKISYWTNEMFYNAKTIKLKNLKEHIKRGSFKFWADRLCIQSLAFIDTAKERQRFDLYCLNAELTNNDIKALEKQGIISAKVVADKKLKVRYATLSRSKSPKDRICSFRDYFRSNDSLQKLITTLEQDDSDLNEY